MRTRVWLVRQTKPNPKPNPNPTPTLTLTRRNLRVGAGGRRILPRRVEVPLSLSVFGGAATQFLRVARLSRAPRSGAGSLT